MVRYCYITIMMSEKFNVLLSFPRSGNTWLRYIAEFLYKRPTCQAPMNRCINGIDKKGVISSDLNLGVDISKKAILIKRHYIGHKWDNWTKENCRMILLVRNYKEAVLRHATASRKNQDIKEIEKCISGYMHCLSSYDVFDGEKMCVYYEDLITRPQQEVRRLVKFLGKPKPGCFDRFFSNYNHHKSKSLNYYKPGAMTRGKVDKLDWHSRCAPQNILDKITKDVKSNSRLYIKYLRRYG